MNWSRQIALEPNLGSRSKLIEQLTLAREMGYTEDEIIQALEMKNHDKKSKVSLLFIIESMLQQIRAKSTEYFFLKLSVSNDSEIFEIF